MEWIIGAVEDNLFFVEGSHMSSIYTLIEILRSTQKFDLDNALYLERKPWSASSQALVLDPDDVEEALDPDSDPKEAKDFGMKYAIMMQDLDDICENLKSQVSSPTDDQLFQAFIYYMENDAFIKLRV